MGCNTRAPAIFTHQHRGSGETKLFVMTEERYTVISADTHAGANHETYREYLDSAYHQEFDDWRGGAVRPACASTGGGGGRGKGEWGGSSAVAAPPGSACGTHTWTATHGAGGAPAAASAAIAGATAGAAAALSADEA